MLNDCQHVYLLSNIPMDRSETVDIKYARCDNCNSIWEFVVSDGVIVGLRRRTEIAN